MEHTFKGNQLMIVGPIYNVSTCTEHTKSINMEATFKGKHKPLVISIGNGNYTY